MINKDTRRLWAEKILDLANIGAGALIFGQILSGKQFVFLPMFIGLLLITLGFLISFLLLKRR